ncbi:P-loop containing nucleoside triphosphate hydrolase protein [Lophiotrema nucula]|uniref:P-loop containing nucleoside triphosphate hydrolase protein n=1 Tax=Lophiotrema nucula TaxID=690887 RepID=A0A6A5YT00_9PLEO|nr:P-loop containing nucleoside triphosphate hydrolase protein [Lophiotrema nucula]
MESDVVIAVMGMTGVGKSSFIKNITNSPDIVIGHGLASETNEVKGYDVTHSSKRYTLVDTPGFDDSFESDESITRMILEWLQQSYQAGTRLNGIIYIHSIAQPRLQGSAIDNICMIRKLCGDGAFGQVVLATTFWNEIDEEIGIGRECELVNNQLYWGRMVKLGSKVKRLHNNRVSALETLSTIAANTEVTLQAQTEMVDQGMTPGQTAAAQFVRSGRRMREIWEEESRKQEQRRREMQEELGRKQSRLEMINKEAAEERKRLRQAYYKKHVCRCRLVGKARCANCGVPIRKVFYHCCWCDTITTFFHCAGCGKRCSDEDHPSMKRQEAYCIVM